LLGILLAFVAQPVGVRLTTWIGARWAVLPAVLASGLALAAAVGGLGWLFVSRGTVLSSDLVAAVGPGGIIDRALARAGSLTERFGVTPDDLRGHLRVLAGAAARSAAHIAEVIASATASAVLGLLFAMLAMHYGLRHGRVYLVRSAMVRRHRARS
jgi:predicted PurR-regulated permease PerM